MKQIYKGKRHPRTSSGPQEPLPADPRDPDIVHAHQAARRARRPGSGRARPGGRAPVTPVSGRR
jgi:hypothetical protein